MHATTTGIDRADGLRALCCHAASSELDQGSLNIVRWQVGQHQASLPGFGLNPRQVELISSGALGRGQNKVGFSQQLIE